MYLFVSSTAGQRANPNQENHSTNRSGQVKSKDHNIIGRIVGLVSNGVIRFHGKTNEMLHHMSIN